MPLQRGEILGYDFNRMVVDFAPPARPARQKRSDYRNSHRGHCGNFV
jgi:hypothetical protein